MTSLRTPLVMDPFSSGINTDPGKPTSSSHAWKRTPSTRLNSGDEERVSASHWENDENWQICMRLDSDMQESIGGVKWRSTSVGEIQSQETKLR